MRAEVGKVEIVRSLRTSDPKVAATRYAKVHAGEERLLAEADGRLASSTDTAFNMALASLRARGINPDDVPSMGHEDRLEARRSYRPRASATPRS